MLKTRDRDSLQRFLFDHAPVRGEVVHLDATWRAVIERHTYPPVVRDLLGQAMAAVALLAATLKFEGKLTLQLQGGGPVSLMVVECTSERSLRGVAKYDAAVEASTLPELIGDGRLIITIDPEFGRERYQGIVPVEGANLAQALEAYLRRSEQLETRIWLEADPTQVAGLLLQQLPGDSEDEDVWRRACQLAATVKREELLSLSGAEIVHRLFHEEDLRLFDGEPVCFRCSCSRERVADVLRSLGHGEVESIVAEQGGVDVHCEFCNQRYMFDPVDAEQLFVAPAAGGMSTMTH